MQTIQFDGQAYQLPEAWQELDPNHLPELVQLVYFTPQTEETSHTLLRIVLGIRRKRWQTMMQTHFGPKVGQRARRANAIVLHTLKHQLRWLYTEPIRQQPFTSLELDFGLELLLPEAGFYTMSYGELTDAYIHFLVYIRQLVQGQKHLDLLVATLCRPRRAGNYQAAPDWNGDHREPYNEHQAKERAKLLAHVEPGYKMAVLLFFLGNMQQILERYELWGQEEGEPEEYPGQGWVKNSHLLAGKGIFGNIDQTKAANVHDVLLFLEEHRKDLLADIAHRNQQEADQ
ncbi:hypothetical protein GGR92_003652 [Spirosoma lacussanchae]|uniref:hypothetical protein n=1 Tax=Spirosoma lacussanchae TaxID=1884249 RepID=UPI00110897DF|nr:hypothetical protein [Spirosoma lacussanchae]